MIELRPYQAEGLAAIWDYFQSGKKGNPCVAWPTGTGKSVVPAVWIKYVMGQWPNQRFLMVTHVKELIQQNYEVLKYVWPNAPVSIYSAGLKLKNAAMPIVFGGVQSMCKHPALFGHRDIIFIDEAHLINQEDTSMYQTFLSTMKLINPQVKVIGMTATPFRMGQGLITDGGLFTDIVHDITGIESFNRLIAEGYISPLIPLRTRQELSVEGVQINKGEFVASQLQLAVDKQEITFNAIKEIITAGQNRRSWLIFSSGIEHAEHIAETLKHFGVDCAAVHSKQEAEFNDKAIKAFKGNTLRAIANYGKLTTGFNKPEIDLIAMLRPTLSVPLWVQMLGRGTRPAEGKKNCIAAGSLVLTNIGLVPIENVSLEMKVWDGVEFVTHNGVIYKGYKEVIEYHGLVATMDHKVYTKKGWKTFRECRAKEIGIAITGNGWEPIRKIENYFTSNEKRKEKIQNSSSMPSMFSNIFQRLQQRDFLQSWMQEMWDLLFLSSKNTKMALCSLQFSERKMYKSERFEIQGLWGAWNKIQFFFSNGNGVLDYRKSWITSAFGNRQNRKQFSLSSWKFKIFNKERKYSKPQNISSKSTSIRNGAVYDILNCGPRHRFTVNGLLVSNCLVLDFAKNTIRLGPINDPVIPRKKGEKTGDVPVKICDTCGAYNHIKARWCCQCNTEFQFKNKLVAKAGSQELLRSDLPIIEEYEVTYPVYSRKDKNGKPHLVVTYYCGMQAFKEFVFPEHEKMAWKYKRWWKLRHGMDAPATVDEVVRRHGELKTPKKIKVWVNHLYKNKETGRISTSPEILSCEF